LNFRPTQDIQLCNIVSSIVSSGRIGVWGKRLYGLWGLQ